jgi:hypothetical protein
MSTIGSVVRSIVIDRFSNAKQNQTLWAQFSARKAVSTRFAHCDERIGRAQEWGEKAGF